jgi:hypothetical protein
MADAAARWIAKNVLLFQAMRIAYNDIYKV